jgi:integrase
MATRYTRRARGLGSVYETKDGRVRGSIVIPRPDGRRSVRRVVSGRTRPEVVRKLEALRRESSATFATGETLGAYLEGWTTAIKPAVRPATFREYAGHVARYWIPKLGTVPLTRLLPGDVERLMAELMADGRSPSTARAVRTTLRRALRDAQRDGLVIQNIAALARPPRVERAEMRALTVDETHRLLEATADHPYGPLYALLVSTGLRLGEALGLTWTDVTASELTVRRSLARADGNGYEMAEPKTRRSRRTVPLPGLAREALTRQRTRQDAQRAAAGSAWQDRLGLVFSDALGRTLSPTVVSHGFRDVADTIDLRGVRLHDLRHSYASALIRASVPLKTVSEALGHSSIVVTADIYAHLTDTSRREAAAAIDRLFG